MRIQLMHTAAGDVKFTPHLEATFRNGKKRPVGSGWRMDETYIKVKGQWKYLYRAVDRGVGIEMRRAHAKRHVSACPPTIPDGGISPVRF
jgi:transposase-like protein